MYKNECNIVPKESISLKHQRLHFNKQVKNTEKKHKNPTQRFVFPKRTAEQHKYLKQINNLSLDQLHRQFVTYKTEDMYICE